MRDDEGRGLPAQITTVLRIERRRTSPDAPTLTATCDHQGRFRIEVPAAWVFAEVQAQLAGWSSTGREVALGAEVAPLELVLRRERTIEVLVRDEVGAPLPGVHVEDAPWGWAGQPRGERAWGDELPVTDAEGRIQLDAIGDHTVLAAWARGCVPALFEVRLPLPRVELILVRGGRLAGRVVPAEAAAGASPAVTAELAVPGSRELPRTLTGPGVRRVDGWPGAGPLQLARCDEQGRFLLEGLPEGRDLLVQFRDLRATARAGDPELILDQHARLGLLRLLPVDARSGEPVSACALDVLSGHACQVTPLDPDLDAEWFRGARVAVRGQGPCELILFAEGHVPRRVPVTLGAGDRLDLGRVPLARGARLTLQARWDPATLSGVYVHWRAPALGLSASEWLDCPLAPAAPLLLRWALPAGTPLDLTVEAAPFERRASPREVLATTLTLTAGETRALPLALR